MTNTAKSLHGSPTTTRKREVSAAFTPEYFSNVSMTFMSYSLGALVSFSNLVHKIVLAADVSSINGCVMLLAEVMRMSFHFTSHLYAPQLFFRFGLGRF